MNDDMDVDFDPWEGYDYHTYFVGPCICDHEGMKTMGGQGARLMIVSAKPIMRNEP